MSKRSLLQEFEENEFDDFYLAVHHCIDIELSRDMNVWLYVHNKTVDDFGLGEKAPNKVMYTKWVLGHRDVNLTDRMTELLDRIANASDEQLKLDKAKAIRYLVPDIEEYVDEDPEGGYDVYKMSEMETDSWHFHFLECFCCFKRDENPKYIRMSTFPPEESEKKNIYYI